MLTPIQVCRLIASDMEADVKRFDGAPLTGKLIGEMHGNLSAGIAGLANLLEKVLLFQFDPDWNCPAHMMGGDPLCEACVAKQPKRLV